MSCVIVGMFILSGACTPPSTGPVVSQKGTTTTIIIIRHAERDPGEFVPLNAEGFRRRDVLRDALAENGVNAIYCTDTLRNQQTVQTLADHFGLSVNLVNPVRYLDTTLAADQLAQEIIANHAGETVLFCGNTGAVSGVPGINAEIYRRLGDTGRAPERYQDLYIAVVPDEGPSRFIKTEYGGPSSLDP
jgi:broad specificity phosphatase PhoE